MPDNVTRKLYYGDNLDVMRKYIRDNTIDLCYIDPPFNSKRTYNQIYNNVGSEDKAQARAFIDTWKWDEHAILGYQDILDNAGGRFTAETIELIKGLTHVLKRGSLLAYLVSMTLRVTEIQRALKPTGSFYLHCDPTASHYLKLVIDSVFLPRGGDFQNEVIWSYRTGGVSKKRFAEKHDVVFFYSKSNAWKFNPQKEKSYLTHRYGFSNVTIYKDDNGDYTLVNMRDVWDIHALRGNQPETLGYPTQKPEALLERIIKASSNEGDLILDAYCGCGTTVAVAQALKRQWIGIDITYQSIALVLRRLEDQFGKEMARSVNLDGIPRDMASAKALANKKDDRVRKEFEKWAVMTYTDNRAMINDKKGADAGIDGIAYFRTNSTDNAKIIFQVKSGNVGRGDIAALRGDMQREGAAMAVFISLQPPTRAMLAEAKATGLYRHELMQRNYDAIQIVTVQEMIEQGKSLDIPMSLEVLRAAERKATGEQLGLMPDAV